jgi:hypothetical protein
VEEEVVWVLRDEERGHEHAAVVQHVLDWVHAQPTPRPRVVAMAISGQFYGSSWGGKVDCSAPGTCWLTHLLWCSECTYL